MKDSKKTDFVFRLIDFDIQSPSEIQTAAVFFKVIIYNYFESIEFVSAGVQAVYNKSGEQILMQDMLIGDFLAIAEFIGHQDIDFQHRQDEWLETFKKNHEDYTEENRVNENR